MAPPSPSILRGKERFDARAAAGERRLRVFLTHASQDKPKVREIYKRLVADGIDAWLDEEKLLPGQDWDAEISNAVRNSDAVIVFMSKASISKEGYLQKELKFALDYAQELPEGDIYIIPIRLDDCEIPNRLSQIQWLDWRDDDKAYERLLAALLARAKSLELKVK